MRLLGGMVKGFFSGLALGVVLFFPTCIGATVVTGSATQGEKVADLLNFLPLIGGVVGAFVAVAESRAKQREAARRAEAEKAAKEAARWHAEAEMEATRQRALLELRRLHDSAQRAAGELPLILAEAELAAARAETEFASKLYSPFWEAVEESAEKLARFERTIKSIEYARSQYGAMRARVDAPVSDLSLGIAALPDPDPTHRRLIDLYRSAQRDAYFAMVYEQRRTNAILIAGFASLGQAIEHLGDRVCSGIAELSETFSTGIADLDHSLSAVAAASAEQHSALMSELRRSSGASDDLLAHVRQEAETRQEHERTALRMLDNIQRRRRPGTLD